MKKLLKLLSALTLAFLFALPAYAATINLSPATISVAKGQNVTITIQADPTGSKLYTVKSSVAFPAGLLEMTSFTPSGGWVALSMPGYDSVDNTNGTVVKTAGYPGGISGNTPFGTLVFHAKESGTATISVSGSSFAYDKDSKNVISGQQGASVISITSPAAVTKKKDDVKIERIENINDDKEVVAVIPKKVVPPVATQTDTQNLAAVAEATPVAKENNSSPMYIWVIVVLGIIAAISYIFYRKRNNP